MSKFMICCIAALITFASNGQKNPDYKIVKTFHIASSGGWDYIAVNKGKLYVSHGTQVNILDEQSGDSLGVIPNTIGIHGIAFDNDLQRGYTSNGRMNNVYVFDLKTFQVLDSIKTGQNPDAINYEPFSKTIVTCNGRSKDLSVIDPKTNKVIATIDVAGKPEAAASDGKGIFYVNIEDKSEIVKVDMKSNTVVAHWPLGDAKGPTGLVYDDKTKRLFAGCDKMLAIVNSENGNIVSTMPIGDGCDGVAFNSKDKLVYTSNGEGTISVIKEKDGDKFESLGNFPTKRGARTIAIDEKEGTIFLPTADFDPTKTNPNGRPMMIPGSFQVIVVK